MLKKRKLPVRINQNEITACKNSPHEKDKIETWLFEQAQYYSFSDMGNSDLKTYSINFNAVPFVLKSEV
jgi:hypothetical protein